MPEIGFAASGCRGFWSAGPVMVICPQGIWFRPTTAEDIDETIEHHIKQGKLVERSLMVFAKG
jgi:(2Fe-2S) ferredoxin